MKITDDENMFQMREINVIEIRQTLENRACLMQNFTNIFFMQYLFEKRKKLIRLVLNCNKLVHVEKLRLKTRMSAV